VARPIAVVGAPSSIGLRPYEDGFERHVNRAPSVLRERGLVTRLRAVDLGDVSPPPYRDFERPRQGARNEPEVLAYSRSLASRVSRALDHGHFALVLGGDCSIVLGCLLAARRRAGRVGLAYLDAHADLATPAESPGGAASNMALSFAVGRGQSALAHLDGPRPLVEPRRAAVIGRREAVPSGGDDPVAAASILDLRASELDSAVALAHVADRALSRIAAHGVRGFWIHVDADVLNPRAMPAVGSPEPGGPMPQQLLAMLAPLVADRRALGMSVSVYDPALDADRSSARQLVNVLTLLLAPGQPAPGAAGCA
jgi:arginase